MIRLFRVLAVALVLGLGPVVTVHAAGDVNTIPAAGARLNGSPIDITATFPSTHGVLDLVDSSGRSLPPTGKGSEHKGNTVIFHNPELDVGVYTLRWSYDGVTGSHSFSVGEPRVYEQIGSERQGPATRVSPLIPLTTGAVLTALVVVSLRRRPILAFSGGAAIALTVTVLTLALISSPPPSSSLTVCTTLQAEFSVAKQDCAARWVVANSGDSPVKVVTLIDSLLGNEALGSANENPCHNVAHSVGRILVEKGWSVDSLVGVDTGNCFWGLTHGALERDAQISSDSQWSTITRTACDTTRSFDDMIQCAHGLGHANAFRTNSEPLAGIALCENLAHLGDYALIECSAAVFMSLASRMPLALGPDGRFDDSQLSTTAHFPIQLCSTLTGPYKIGCWKGSMNYLQLILRTIEPLYQLPAVALFCAQQAAEDASLCLAGMGYHSGDLPRAIPQNEVASACRALSDVLKLACIRGFALGAIDRPDRTPLTEAEHARELVMYCEKFTDGYSDALRRLCAQPERMPRN